MKRIAILLFAVAMVAGVGAALAQISTGADVKPAPQSAGDAGGESPYAAVVQEPAPRVILGPRLGDGLCPCVFWAQHRLESLRIVPVFGAGALQVSPRVGHLHIIVDVLPWWWADAS